MKFKIRAINHRDELLSKVITLGSRNSKTLGLFPEGAFHDHAKKMTIVTASDDEGSLAGYVLYRISQRKRMVSITHLCVDEKYRKHGLPMMLLDAVKEKYKDSMKGISLSCREDYQDATKVWKRAGFKAIDSKRSKSRDEHYLIKWIFDFGNPDLFSHQEVPSDKVKALLDSSVLLQMSEPATPYNTEHHALKADWLAEEADFYYAPEIFNEINRDKNRGRSQNSRDFVKKFLPAQFRPQERDKISNSLKLIKAGNTENDVSDRSQLAECIAAGIKYFITLDDGILTCNETLFNTFQVRALRPSEFILLIDELSNTMDYHSFRLAGANYHQAKVKSDEIDVLISEFCGLNANETQYEIRSALNSCINDPKKGAVKIVKDRDGKAIACYTMVIAKGSINVNFIRIKSQRIAGVLFQQLLRELILSGLEKEINVINLTDPHISASQENILNSVGFERVNQVWTKISITGIHPVKTIMQHPSVKQIFDVEDFESKLEATEDHSSARLLVDLERKLWPVKLLELKLPTYIIPIKPLWAGQLFDHYIAGNDLFGAKERLAWSRENVYYRSVRPVSEQAPGRILWYLSSDTGSVTGRANSIVACSYLDEVHIDTVQKVFKKFQHYGIYEWKDVYKLARKKIMTDIKALKFSDTEVFKNIVPLNVISKIMIANDRPKNTFASPVAVSNNIFQAIYKLGTNE